MPIIFLGVAVVAAAAWWWSTQKPRRVALPVEPPASVAELEARIRALGLDPSRIDEREAAILLEGMVYARAMSDRWAAATTDEDRTAIVYELSNDGRFIAMMSVLEDNYTTDELMAALRRGGLRVTP